MNPFKNFHINYQLSGKHFSESFFNKSHAIDWLVVKFFDGVYPEERDIENQEWDKDIHIVQDGERYNLNELL